MLPPGAVAVSPSAVAPLPTPQAQGGVAPAAGRFWNHVAGVVRGARLTYADLNACAWYAAGGWDLRNHRKLRRRGLCGVGDTDDVTKR